ncbi:isocitrate lyase/PEP mutase family protein [Afifella pfennigii]|uniref:isocitrate lyase/PEP mutase family protein n=1 Tax=Afifella pfennigii TaxID=209897 RepID=UPI00047CA2D0|nr:isocitrate lyase/phosphoenolpyruvate mutase family protein [Afifella pfennigii]
MASAAASFRALHARRELFLMPNPWDVGTARLLADLGFKALATSSAALAWSLGRPDATGAVTRADAIAHAGEIVRATPLPVNGDLESGFGDSPSEVAETIRQAIDIGLAGCSVEDMDQASGELYPLAEALRRFAAAREAVAKSGSDFVLTGRCEVFFTRNADPLGEAVRRLKAFEAAGADVLYAPGLTTEREVAEILAAVSAPVNVLGGVGGVSNDVAALERLGVTRISIGSGLAKVALGAFLDAAGALAHRRFAFDGAATSSTLNGAFAAPPRDDDED